MLSSFYTRKWGDPVENVIFSVPESYHKIILAALRSYVKMLEDYARNPEEPVDVAIYKVAVSYVAPILRSFKQHRTSSFFENKIQNIAEALVWYRKYVLELASDPSFPNPNGIPYFAVIKNINTILNSFAEAFADEGLDLYDPADS